MTQPAHPSRSKARFAAFLAGLLGLAALSGCAFPRKDFSSVPGPDVIRVTQDDTGFRAVPPECEPLLQPSQLNKASDIRLSIAFGCATYTNLAEQLARPQDLTHPRPYAGQSADTAGAAVQRYRENQVIPLKGTQSTNVGAE